MKNNGVRRSHYYLQRSGYQNTAGRQGHLGRKTTQQPTPCWISGSLVCQDGYGRRKSLLYFQIGAVLLCPRPQGSEEVVKRANRTQSIMRIVAPWMQGQMAQPFFQNGYVYYWQGIATKSSDFCYKLFPKSILYDFHSSPQSQSPEVLNWFIDNLTELHDLRPWRELTNYGRINHLWFEDLKRRFCQISIYCGMRWWASFLHYLLELTPANGIVVFETCFGKRRFFALQILPNQKATILRWRHRYHI